eukprot:CAMPEP_0202878418 /NCGR_PEP_ID=MMETSP1391-20130828/32157_1 /ASSEMBLY_ACC=CAM_ASM_000867 /TAXON_ID=1034604 /ORGANISM="Chlamydomonas leiostraca, Strain SAG 11-49" /LENGTH=36 /DNA_ID= /DNA_START= /DNA_END= /DNA_ORIENTATION=
MTRMPPLAQQCFPQSCHHPVAHSLRSHLFTHALRHR